MTEQRWPDLTLSAWADTRETVHMWTQIVGKVRLALDSPVNHWWHIPLYVSARGLTTSLMHSHDFGAEIEFDFLNHVLVIRTTENGMRTVPLEPRTVASFYDELMAALGELGLRVTMLGRPVEVVEAIPFEKDTVHEAYDGDAINRFWRALVEADRVFKVFRGGFVGKASPVHFFWGGFDLAVTRFSGRTAPKHRGGVPNCADWVMEEAYSHEVSSCGFWPGGSEEGSFYSYAYPEPDGFAAWPIDVPGARYDSMLGEFLLPYRDVRTAADPDATLLAFLQQTYEAAATTGNWDRAALERASTRAELR
jgi:hypothetical protein